MGKLLALILIFLFVMIITALPLYLVVNLCFLVFHLPYHITILQAFAICALVAIVKNILFRKGDD